VGGGRNDQDEIHFLKTKAREGRNWALLSQTLMEEGRGEMTRVSPVSFTKTMPFDVESSNDIARTSMMTWSLTLSESSRAAV